MEQQFIQLAQSVTGAVIAIIGLLLVAGIIGYLTAWFYAKSVYTPVIKTLEKEKSELQSQVADLTRQVEVMSSEIKNLSVMIEDQNNKIKGLEQTITEKDKEIKKLSAIKQQ